MFYCRQVFTLALSRGGTAQLTTRRNNRPIHLHIEADRAGLFPLEVPGSSSLLVQLI